MRTVYEAILLAADHIERNPQDFNFGAIYIPHGCGSPGCALGWVGFHLGITNDTIDASDGWLDRIQLTAHRLGCDSEYKPHMFYSRMDALCGSSNWQRNASLCAATLRLYAAKYHAPAKPEPVAPHWETMIASWPQREFTTEPVL